MSSNIRITRICQHCGKSFEAKTTVTKYCGDTCAKQAYKAKIRNVKLSQSNNETQAIISKPLTVLKEKEFLSVAEVAKLLNSSKQTVYSLIRSGTIHAVNLKKKKTVVPRAGIDALFRLPEPQIYPEAQPSPVNQQNQGIETYSLAEIKERFGISDSTIYQIVKKHNITKVQKGKFVLVSRKEIDDVLIKSA